MGPIAPPIPTSAFVESVLSHLEALPQLQRRLFMKRRMTDQYPRFFYKYFGLNPTDEKSVDSLRDVVVQSHFWLSHHERFNDPFDLKANVVFEATREQKEKRFKQLIANVSGARRKERRGQLRQMLKRSDEEWLASLNSIFRERAKEVGVCSFAGNARSILMWAHYGRSHEGVCLQFETALAPRVFTYAQEVEYSEEYPRVDYLQDFENQVLIPMVRKHQGWAYEQEWRLLHFVGANTSFPFDPAGLRRIIFGCRAPKATYACARALLDERYRKGLPQVQLFRAEQHATQYKLQLWRVRP